MRQFQSIIGSLLFITYSCRPDLCFVVNQLAQHMGKPSKQHLNAAIQVVQYLKATSQYGLCFTSKFHANLLEKWSVVAWCDASHCANFDLKPILGYAIFINNNLFKYKTKKWKRLTGSSCESEFVAVYELSKELINVLNMVEELRIPIHTPRILCDNQAAIAIIKTHKELEHAKCIRLSILRIREWFRNKTLRLHYVRTAENIADVLTKALPAGKFSFFRTYLLHSENLLDVSDVTNKRLYSLPSDRGC